MSTTADSPNPLPQNTQSGPGGTATTKQPSRVGSPDRREDANEPEPQKGETVILKNPAPRSGQPSKDAM